MLRFCDNLQSVIIFAVAPWLCTYLLRKLMVTISRSVEWLLPHDAVHSADYAVL